MIPCEVLPDESYKNLPDSFYRTALLSSGSAIRKCYVPWACYLLRYTNSHHIPLIATHQYNEETKCYFRLINFLD